MCPISKAHRHTRSQHSPHQLSSGPALPRNPAVPVLVPNSTGNVPYLAYDSVRWMSSALWHRSICIRATRLLVWLDIQPGSRDLSPSRRKEQNIRGLDACAANSPQSQHDRLYDSVYKRDIGMAMPWTGLRCSCRLRRCCFRSFQYRHSSRLVW